MSAVARALPRTNPGDIDRQREWLLPIVLALMTTTFFVYWESARSLLDLWTDTNKTTYTHGYIVAALSLWLVFKRREAICGLPVQPDVAASIGLVVCGLVWLITVRSGIELAYILLLPVLMLLAVSALLGRHIARQTAIPIAFLFFATPVWDLFNSTLQGITVVAAGSLLRVTAIPAYAEGNLVHLSVGSFEIAGGCSGLHFFMVALALGALYGELGRDTIKVRLQLIALSALLAMVGNWLRVYVIIVAGYLTDMQHYLVRVEHYYFGWFVFAIMMTIFFIIARRIPAAAPAAAPQINLMVERSNGFSRTAFSATCLCVIPLTSLTTTVRPAQLPAIDQMLGPAVAAWSIESAASTPRWQPAFVGADLQARRDYSDADHHRAQVYAAAYTVQSQQKELVGYSNSLFDSSIETAVSDSASTLRVGGRELILERDGAQAILWYSYRIGSVQTGSGVRAQLQYGLASLSGEAPLSEIYAVRSDCIPDCATARALIGNFLDASMQRNLGSER